MIASGRAHATTAASAALCERIATDNLEECDAWLRAGGLAVRHDQMSHGLFAADVALVRLSRDLDLTTSRYATAMATRGAVPAGRYALCLPVSDPAGVYVNHRPLRRRAISVLRPQQEFQLYRAARFRPLVLYLDAALIERQCAARFGRPLPQVTGVTQTLSSSAASVAFARRTAQICDQFARCPNSLRAMLARPGGADRLAAQIVDDVLDFVSPPEPARGWSARQRTVNRAWEIVEDDDVVTVSELCARMEMAIRTLDDAFRACLGVAPKRFLLAMRLNKARRRLRRPDDRTTVTDAATAFGFFHFGHFGRQYRALFGEPPSQTLRRTRGAVIRLVP
jgi:AraC family ethanolamine operon transcriptional activator